MKILQASNLFHPCFDAGVSGVVYEISKELKAKGHEVTVYSTDGCTARLNVKTNKMVFVDGIEVYYFKNLSNTLNTKLNLATPYYLFRKIKDIKNFDIIHIHEHRTFFAVFLHHYAMKYNVPYIIQSHGSVLPFLHKITYKKIFDKLWGYKILNHASQVIALTQSESEQYQKMGVPLSKIKIIPNGINEKEYENIPKKNKFREKNQIKAGEKIVLFLGRLHESKGIEILIKAFLEVTSEYKSIKLAIVGPDNGFLDSLEILVKNLDLEDKVIFTGPLYGNDKMEAYMDSDVFVTPRYTGFPITFLESCAYGLPIITTNRGDELDWINDNVGYVTDYDEHQLAQAILNIILNDSLRNKFGDNGKKLIKSNFNWQNIVDKIEEVYKEVKG